MTLQKCSDFNVFTTSLEVATHQLQYMARSSLEDDVPLKQKSDPVSVEQGWIPANLVD